MKKLFYSLFFIDVVIGIILLVFVNLFVACVTTFTLLFINIVTFYIINKILKIQQEYNLKNNHGK